MKNRRISNWRKIIVVDDGPTTPHELDEYGRLKTKFPRQPRRKHLVHNDEPQPFSVNTSPQANYAQGTNNIHNMSQPPPTNNSNMIMPNYAQGTYVIHNMYQPPPTNNSNMIMPNYTQGTNIYHNMYQPPPANNLNMIMPNYTQGTNIIHNMCQLPPTNDSSMIMPNYTQGTNIYHNMYQPPPTNYSNPTLLYNQAYATGSTNIDTNLNSVSEVEKSEQDDTTISSNETFNDFDLDCKLDDDFLFQQDNPDFFDFNDDLFQ